MQRSGKALRIAAIIFLGLTALMNVLGGAGTSCVAFSSNVGYRMACKELMDVRWVYQGLVVATILVGLVGIWITTRLFRGGLKGYRNALIVLGIGTVLGGVHYFTSLALRGKAAPANVKFYINLFTLIIFLLYLIPGIRERVDFASPGSDRAEKASTAGLTAILAGILILTVFSWAGPSHTFDGENWVYVLYAPLMTGGTLLITGGVAFLVKAFKEMTGLEPAHPNQEITARE
jgi:hypothetical protein